MHNKLLLIIFSVTAILTPISAMAQITNLNDAKTAFAERNIDATLDGERNTLNINISNLLIKVFLAQPDNDLSFLVEYANVTPRQVPLEYLNRYNREVKFGRAYFGNNGKLFVQMDRNGKGGLSKTDLLSDLDTFLLLLGKLKRDLTQ